MTSWNGNTSRRQAVSEGLSTGRRWTPHPPPPHPPTPPPPPHPQPPHPQPPHPSPPPPPPPPHPHPPTPTPTPSPHPLPPPTPPPHTPISSIGRPFRSPLRRRRNMAALPLPAAILDDLIPSFPVPGMRSSKMAAGSGRAAILRLRLNGDRKGRPKSWLTSFPAPPSWIQDGGATSNVWRTS